ncbi:MalY/PatB family protein [Flavobacterium psychrotrophum]|uniref:MalY/PatB family protein n=1 Tax=Flavobacterium psychrotrophum TaxID=2294119 RepID=UPI000E30BBDA|nr:MalY/PatB family protein [Flavobacterium psychrotrophum]
MEFNFDEITDRRNTNSIKWDAAPSSDILPMWVADMDFKAAPAIIEALQKRVTHGVFGYTQMPSRFYDAIINWWQTQHNFSLQKDWVIPTSGVIPALSAIIRSLVNKGGKVIIQPPVYNHFYTTLENCGCEVLENNLIYSDGNYSIDFNDLELKASNTDAKLLLLSNPHNPVGRVWTFDELQKIGDICLRHNVIVISDEIHADLTLRGFKHTPYASIGKKYANNSITLSSPSKAFNLAGLQVGYLFTENAGFREQIQKTLLVQEMELLSPFAIEALIAAYNDGTQWLDAVKVYLYDNYLYLKSFVEEQLPQLKVIPLQATYLVWLDCCNIPEPASTLTEKLLNEHKLWLNAGSMYGSVGAHFLRINIACPRQTLREGLGRLLKAFS